VRAREMMFLTASEVESLADTIGGLKAPGGRQAALAVRLAAYTGLRAGEQWGLRVRDVNLVGRRLSVSRALKDTGGSLIMGPTKTHQARTVVFPRALVTELNWLADQRPGPESLLFVGAYGAPVRHNLFVQRAFRPAVRKVLAAKSTLRWHDLRHTYASLAAMAGAQPKDVQAQLGHASVMMTLDRYTHLFPEQADRLADRLDALLRGDDDEPPTLAVVA
jgi:integrase